MLEPKTDFLIPFYYVSYRNKVDREKDGNDKWFMTYLAFLDLSQFGWKAKRRDPSSYMHFHRIQIFRYLHEGDET